MWCGGHQNTQLSFGIIIIVEFAIIMVRLLFLDWSNVSRLYTKYSHRILLEKNVCFYIVFCREGRQVIQKFQVSAVDC